MMTFKDFEELFPGFKGTLYLYITGSQGVAPAEMTVEYGKDFVDKKSLMNCFDNFIDTNAAEYIDSYLEDCDGDEDDAMGEAITDSGNFFLGIDENHLTHEYVGCDFSLITDF